jgi:hypothetical protein
VVIDAEAELASDLDRLRVVTTVDHERLFGVERELHILGESLKLRDAAWIISIFGGPGVGKTALGYELVKRYAREAGFRRVASVSAKFSHIDRIGHLEEDTLRAETDWRDLLVELAQQLAPGMDFNAGLIEQQLPASMPQNPCLIVVDNLEPAPAVCGSATGTDPDGRRRPSTRVTSRPTIRRWNRQGATWTTWSRPRSARPC